MKKLSSILLIFTIFFAPIQVEAQEGRGKFSLLDKDERAPFSGVLYDALGNAIILSERRRLIEEHALSLLEQEERLTLEFQKDLDIFEATIKIQEEKYERIIDTKDTQIAELEKEASKKGLPGWAWLLMGVAAGAAGGIATIYFLENR